MFEVRKNRNCRLNQDRQCNGQYNKGRGKYKKEKTIVDKTLHRKVMIEQDEPCEKPEVNSGAFITIILLIHKKEPVHH